MHIVDSMLRKSLRNRADNWVLNRTMNLAHFNIRSMANDIPLVDVHSFSKFVVYYDDSSSLKLECTVTNNARFILNQNIALS